ncbi:MAG: energy transducer TonB [Desulfobacterales bacterium]|nr:energy transducer TonB [Desulfobacterales bacterium]
MSRSLLPGFLLALILHTVLAWVDFSLFKRPIPIRDLPKTLTIDIVRPQPAKRPLTVKRPSIIVERSTLKEERERNVKPKPRVKPRNKVKERIQPRLPQRGISGQAEKSIAKERPPKIDATLAQLSPVDLPTIKKEEVFSPSHTPITHALPMYRKNTPPQYPLLARRRGYQGKVLLEVLVKKDGRAGSIRLARSSGYEVLDRAAIKGVRNWLFHPAKRGNELVELWVEIPIRFQLK